MTNPSDKQQTIICAAVEIFATTGYAASNVPSIAKRANVSVGSIYHYFQNKQDILNLSFQSVLKEFWKSIGPILQSDFTTKDKFSQVFDTAINLIDENTTALHFVYQNIFNHDLNDISEHLRSSLLEKVSQFLHDGQQDGTFSERNIDSQIALFTGSLIMMVNFMWIGKHVDDETVLGNESRIDLKNQIWHALTNSQNVFTTIVDG